MIARSGQPIARLAPHDVTPPRTPGRWRGQVTIAEDVDETPDEVIALFVEGSIWPQEEPRTQ